MREEDVEKVKSHWLLTPVQRLMSYHGEEEEEEEEEKEEEFCSKQNNITSAMQKDKRMKAKHESKREVHAQIKELKVLLRMT